MAYKKLDDLIIENGQIIFRNFSGKESKYNREGCRNFCVIIEDPDMAQRLIDDGWNVRSLPPRDENEDLKYYLQVAVNFMNIPPKVMMVTRKSKIAMDEESIDSLDFAEIKNADIIIRPYHWAVNEKTGIKAYLKNLYITIEEDVFAKKYENVEEMDEPF